MKFPIVCFAHVAQCACGAWCVVAGSSWLLPARRSGRLATLHHKLARRSPPEPISPLERASPAEMTAVRAVRGSTPAVTASVWAVLRPASWSRLTGESPVRVGTGAPGSRPRFVVERRQAERGVKCLSGGSKRAGCSVKRTLQPRHMCNGEPSRSCHGEGHVRRALVRGQAAGFSRGTEGGTRVQSGPEQERRSSVSRMRENRTYGLKGGWGNGPAQAPRPRLPMARRWADAAGETPALGIGVSAAAVGRFLLPPGHKEL